MTCSASLNAGVILFLHASSCKNKGVEVTEHIVGIFKKHFKIVMQKRMCKITEIEVIIMEIVLFVNEQQLGETNINDEDIPLTPNMLATGRPR